MSTFISDVLGVGQEDLLAILTYSVLGIALGVGVNKLNRFLSRQLRRVYASRWASIPLKLLPVGLVLVALHWQFKDFSDNWQNTIPGLFFVTFFFGLQTSLLEDVLTFA